MWKHIVKDGCTFFLIKAPHWCGNQNNKTAFKWKSSYSFCVFGPKCVSASFPFNLPTAGSGSVDKNVGQLWMQTFTGLQRWCKMTLTCLVSSSSSVTRWQVPCMTITKTPRLSFGDCYCVFACIPVRSVKNQIYTLSTQALYVSLYARTRVKTRWDETVYCPC